MKEEITIDGLASKMEDGFVSSKQTVDTLAVKVDDLALSVKDVVKSIEDLAIATARGFNDVESRLTKKIETEIQSVRTELSTKIQTETQSVRTDLSAEIQSVRSDLGHKIDSFRSEILGEFRKLKKRIDVLEVKLDRIDKVTNEEIMAIGSDLHDLKSKVKKLEQKFSKLKLANQ